MLHKVEISVRKELDHAHDRLLHRTAIEIRVRVDSALRIERVILGKATKWRLKIAELPNLCEKPVQKHGENLLDADGRRGFGDGFLALQLLDEALENVGDREDRVDVFLVQQRGQERENHAEIVLDVRDRVGLRVIGSLNPHVSAALLQCLDFFLHDRGEDVDDLHHDVLIGGVLLGGHEMVQQVGYSEGASLSNATSTQGY